MSSLEASQLDYNLGYRAQYSDNITRIPNEREGQAELINTVNFDFSFLADTSTTKARVAGSVAYDNYYNSTYENRTNYNLDAYGEAFFVERTLSWVVADGYRMLLVDPLSPDTPTNRENSNALATGPNVYLRFGSVDTVTLEGRFGRAWVDTIDIDNDRYSYAARWAHRTSQRSTLSLNYEYFDVDYENNDLNNDVLKYNYYLRASILDTRTQFIVDLGRTKIEQVGYDPVSDWLFRLTASKQTTAVSNVRIAYRREYSDTGGELLASATASDPSAGSGMPQLGADVVSSEPFYIEETNFFYMRSGSTFPWIAGMLYRKIDYEITPNDRQEKGARVDVRYIYSSSISFELLSAYNMFTYDQLLREDRESEVGLALNYRMTPNLQAGLAVRRFGRKSTEPDQEYTDNRFALTFMYNSRAAGR